MKTAWMALSWRMLVHRSAKLMHHFHASLLLFLLQEEVINGEKR